MHLEHIMKVVLSYHFSFFSVNMAGPGMLSFTRTEKYCTKLADEVTRLRGEKCLIDFKIHVKDDVFSCAKFVMAAHSPMLHAMLTSDMAEVAKQEIRLDHIRKDIIQIILDYMYCEDVSFHKDQLMDLLAASDYLQMTELRAMCLDEVPSILESDNVISWWKEAAKMNYDTIKEKCEEIMAAGFKEISHQTDFLNLDLNEMQHYVDDICNDTVSSDDAIDAYMRWVSHNEERTENLGDLLHNVKLANCSAEGIKSIIKTHELLLDNTPVVCKLLLNTLADIATNTAKTRLDVVVVVGGEEVDDTVSRDCWEVNHASAEIAHLCDIPVDDLGLESSVCIIPQGFVITGGKDKRLCIMFTAATQSWVRLQDLIESRLSHGSICTNEVLYVLGGHLGKSIIGGEANTLHSEPSNNDSEPRISDSETSSEDSGPSASVHSMVMACGRWEHEADMPLAVTLPKVSNIANTVYLLDAENSMKLLQLDDKKVWSELAPLPVEGPCYGINMISARGRLFVAGGKDMTCAWYNPDSNTWCTGQQPLGEHIYGALACHNDKLLLLGGSYTGGTDEVEEYDIDNDTWSMCSYKMPRKLCGHHAFILDMP